MNWKTICVLCTLCAVSICPVGHTFAGPVNIAVDLDSTYALPSNGPSPLAVQTQPGFTSWDITYIDFAGATKSIDGVTFTIFGLPGLMHSRYRNASTSADVPGDLLLRDFVFNEAEENCYIGLRITGLDVGTYAMNSWHYDGFSFVLQAGNTNFIQIETRNQGQPSPPPVVDNFAFQMAPASFQFSVDAPGQVKEIIFREDSLKNATRLNGFTLTTIPEPTTAWLTTLSLATFTHLPRRRRNTT